MVSDSERMANRIGCMDRDALVAFLHRLKCEFPLDFTPEFLHSISLERLQHIVLAAALHDRDGSFET